MKTVMVVHTCNPSTQGGGELDASLGYRASKTLSQKKNQTLYRSFTTHQKEF
jgi:hypothetical protein